MSLVLVRLHLLVLSLRPDTLAPRTCTSIIFVIGTAVFSFRISIPGIVHLVVYLSASGHTTGIMMLPGSEVTHTALIYDGHAPVEGIVHQRYTWDGSICFLKK